MDINIRLSLDAPRGWKRRMLLYVATPIALVTAASALAYAYDTSWIADKQPVSASALKGNLDEIQTRLAALEAKAAALDGTLTTQKVVLGGLSISLFTTGGNGISGTCDQFCAVAPNTNGVCLAAWSNSDAKMTCGEAQTYARCLCAAR